MVVCPSIGGGRESDVWSVQVLRNLKFLNVFKKFQVFEFDIFWKLQFPPEVTRYLPPIFLTSATARFCHTKWKWRDVFYLNDGLLPNSWVSRLKIFVSECTSNPFPMCLRGATPTKSLPGACGVFQTRKTRYKSKTSSYSSKMANQRKTHQSRTKLNDRESNGIA